MLEPSNAWRLIIPQWLKQDERRHNHSQAHISHNVNMHKTNHHVHCFQGQIIFWNLAQNAMPRKRTLRRASLLKLCLLTSAFVTPRLKRAESSPLMPREAVDEDRVWAAHRRFQLEEDLLRDFGPRAGGENASQSVACQRHRAKALAEKIVAAHFPAETYFFQGSSSRSTFMTVAHSQLSDFDVVFLCDQQWLHSRGADAFADLANELKQQVVSDFGREELHYMGRELQIDEHQFTFVEGRCGVELKVSVDHGWCEDESTDFVLAYHGTDPGSIVVFDQWQNRWRKNNPVRLAALIKEVEAKQPYYGMVVRMLKEWNQHCPPLRTTRAGTVMGGVTLLDAEVPPEFGGPSETMVLRSFPDGEMKSDGTSTTKLKRPMTGLHIEMALCLQHDGFRHTFWAKQLNSNKNLQARTEDMLAREPETPCAIDLLVGAVEHLIATLAIPISTPGDEISANEAMLKNPELVQSTQDLLCELLLELKKLQQEPETPDATGFLRSRLLRNPGQWNDYWKSWLDKN